MYLTVNIDNFKKISVNDKNMEPVDLSTHFSVHD